MEIGLLSRIQHPNVINLFAYKFKSDNCGNVTAMLVFEYAYNGDLDGFMKKCKYLPEKIAKSLIKFVLNGLKCLHSKKMIHRDIKPHNILLDFQFQPKLSDFGLSRDRTTKHPNASHYNYNKNVGCGSSSTWKTNAAGTCAYMSLEAREGEISREGDIFSVGVMLWNIMIGEYGTTNQTIAEARAPFGFERKSYQRGTDSHIVEYSVDELYEKIQYKEYQEYYQLVKQKFEKQNMNFHPLSQSFLDLFVQMVANDKKDRPSIAKIFKHEWMNHKKLLTQFQLRNEMKKLYDYIGRCDVTNINKSNKVINISNN